jgi:integrase
MARRPRQRRNGEGTVITFRKKGKPIGYCAELTVSWNEDGKRMKVRSRRFKERTDAEAELAKLRKQHEQGIDLTTKPQTLRDYGADWLDDFELRARKSSVVTYRLAFMKHIIPQLGDTEVRQIRTPSARKFLTTLTRRGLAPKTVTLIRSVLHQILEQAVEDDLLEYNPVDRAKGPEIKKGAGKAMTLDQVAALLEAARGERLELALRLLFVFGLRRGEVCGLRWKDIDLENGTLTITGTLGYVPGYGLMRGDPKSETGERAFKLPASLIAAFRWHQTRQAAERKAMGGRWRTPANVDEDYVFVSATTGGALDSDRIYDAFKRAAKQIGLEGFSPHSLRHSAASYLHIKRAPKKTISVYLGHSDTRITDDIYTHLFQEELNEAAELVEDGLEAAIEKRRKTGGSAP